MTFLRLLAYALRSNTMSFFFFSCKQEKKLKKLFVPLSCVDFVQIHFATLVANQASHADKVDN